jgi:hypothetical protein
MSLRKKSPKNTSREFFAKTNAQLFPLGKVAQKNKSAFAFFKKVPQRK